MGAAGGDALNLSVVCAVFRKMGWPRLPEDRTRSFRPHGKSSIDSGHVEVCILWISPDLVGVPFDARFSSSVRLVPWSLNTTTFRMFTITSSTMTSFS
jgi:hypothetical protein